MKGDDIVITGFSAYFPQADHLVEFKEKLYAGECMVTEDDSRWPPGFNGLPRPHGKIRDLTRFDAQFFNTHPKQAHVMDPQLRLLLETSYEAIMDAGYDPEKLRKRKIGVFIGNSTSESNEAFKMDPAKMDGYVLLGCHRAMFSNRISYSLDLQVSRAGNPRQSLERPEASHASLARRQVLDDDELRRTTRLRLRQRGPTRRGANSDVFGQ
ncbi:fatty acid synthase-like [Dermacentor silvarum]|uniref:fatty acid synthase-like n=1 Tax=Dermacentor silvarum TaxID=543639 RepID=UPI001897D2AA|nr:fatty acid synthase-like [Dermacentor silvarum]